MKNVRIFMGGGTGNSTYQPATKQERRALSRSKGSAFTFDEKRGECSVLAFIGDRL